MVCIVLYWVWHGGHGQMYLSECWLVAVSWRLAPCYLAGVAHLWGPCMLTPCWSEEAGYIRSSAASIDSCHNSLRAQGGIQRWRLHSYFHPFPYLPTVFQWLKRWSSIDIMFTFAAAMSVFKYECDSKGVEVLFQNRKHPSGEIIECSLSNNPIQMCEWQHTEMQPWHSMPCLGGNDPGCWVLFVKHPRAQGKWARGCFTNNAQAALSLCSL